MEVHIVPDLGYADAYLIQATEQNSHLTSSPLEPFGAMYNEGVPEFVVDQGMYYPTSTNYGYICTGSESPGDWDDHHRVFGVDGQDIQYVGAQTESLPYVYYTPSYGYSQSPYNPYNPYIPGAMIGVDGSFMGAPQYYTIPYENTASSPAYLPMVVQGPDGLADPFMDTASSTRSDGIGFRRNPSSASTTVAVNPGRSVANHSNSFARGSEGFKANGGSSKLPASNGSVASGSFPSTATSQVFQGRGAQAVDDHGKALSNRQQLKVAVPSGNGLSNFGSSANGRVIVDKVRPKLHFGRVVNDVNGSSDALTEQNRGPRINKSKMQLSVRAYTNRAGDSDAQGNIIIYTDQYNKDNFAVEVGNAKFFVIKSYSEDDVHKSIKYNVWSSTPNGNKKLNSAYEDAQSIAAGEPRGCPIFLFFSVNASGQFCGVAEMTGPVDFHRDMDFWQQDKWSGCFPVKWHIIKDVPNPNFRHIILENNEHKPVTNSRDTQEIRFKKGVEMLKVFKNYTSKTSLLDDFMYYENRQKILQEEKARILIKSYGTPLFVPVLDPPRKFNSGLNLPYSGEKKTTLHNDSNTTAVSETTSSNQVTLDTDVSKQVTLDTNVSNSGIRNDEVNEMVGEKAIEDELKIGSLAISPKQAEPKSAGDDATGVTSATVSANAKVVDVVTVGSMPIKVNGLAKPSGILTVGTIQLDPRALNVERKGLSTNHTKAGSQKFQG